MTRARIIIPREVLLVEIERRCGVGECKARNRLGLTKDEARAYSGFECETCKEWNEDMLVERYAPEWWEEIKITDLYSLRESKPPGAPQPDELIERMSGDYRRIKNGN
jgi:hypothetical protein